jgi:hypothetical protein
MGVHQEKDKEAKQTHENIAEEEGQDLDEGENIFVQSGARGGVNRSYVLLDNQSTVNQIANPSLLANIRNAKNPITVHCNNGSSYTNLEGDLGGMTMYHNPYGIANVPSLESTKVKHRVTYDSCDHDGVFKVHTVGGARFCRLVLILTLVSIGLQRRIGVAGKIPSYLLSSIYSSFAKLWCENYGETQGRGDIHSLYLQ